MAVRALPEEFGAEVAAADTNVRIHVEDRVVREVDVSSDERGLEVESRQRVPDRLVQRERMRVDGQRFEQELERSGGLTLGRVLFRQRLTGPPFLDVGRNQPPAQRGKPRQVVHLPIR